MGQTFGLSDFSTQGVVLYSGWREVLSDLPNATFVDVTSRFAQVANWRGLICLRSTQRGGDLHDHLVRKDRQKRSRTITAARELFYAQGYRKTTTQQCARASKVASGTLFLYAKTREELLLLVFYDEFVAIVEAIPVSADETGSRREAG